MERLRIVIEGWTLDSADKAWVQAALQRMLDTHDPFERLNLKAGPPERESTALH